MLATIFLKTLGVVLLIAPVAFINCGKEEGEKESQEIQSEQTAVSTPLVAAAQVEVEKNINFTRQPIKSGYVKAIALNIRRGPGTSSEITGHVFKGDQLEIYQKSKNWYEVEDKAGYVDGWVLAAYISDRVVKSDFIIPDDYNEPRTPTVDESVSAKYVGVKACVPCHNKPHAGFAFGAYGVWRDHYHASAYQTLSRPYTIALAQKRGIKDPLNDWRCVKCHVTALGVSKERLGPKYSDEDGVGCEACHGPGGDYLLKHFGANAGDETQLRAMGFRIYTDLNERDQLCRSCHNELSPTYKPFNVEAFSAAIRHWGDEYAIEVAEAEKPPVISKPKKVERKPPPSIQEIKKVVAPPPLPQEKDPKKKQSGDVRLAGIARDWMLNVNGERGQVFFPHFEHLKSHVLKGREAEVCSVCHHTTKAGRQPGNCSDGACHKFESTNVVSREKAFHGSCRTCHRAEDSGPQKCSQCHNR